MGSEIENAINATDFNSVTGPDIWHKVDSLDWVQVNIEGFEDTQNTDAQLGFTFNREFYVGITIKDDYVVPSGKVVK